MQVPVCKALSLGEEEENRNFTLISDRVKNVRHISGRLHFPVLFNLCWGREWRFVPELFAFLLVNTHITA